MNMPTLNGTQAAKQIREYERSFDLERTPIALLTANRYRSLNHDHLIDMDEYIPKPFNLKQLLSTIVKYTSNIQFDHTSDTYEKMNRLKEIRDRFINGKNITHLILNTRDKFTSIEYDMVENFLNCKEKRDFNTLYNQIMKYIRKNLSG
jgi:CheY-like chemotaxis protein